MSAIEEAYKTPLNLLVPRSFLSNVDAPYGSSISQINTNIPTLTKFETKCLMLQLGYLESLSNVAAVSGTKFGKYQVSEFVLEKYGYRENNLWTGLDGIDTDSIFLSNSRIQDKIMFQFLEDSYVLLIKNNAIRENDSKEIVAGMLAVSYQFQDAENPALKKLEKIANNTLDNITTAVNINYAAVKTKIWRDVGDQFDSQGRNGALYYNAGKYAVQNLAADVPA